ncbi:MAG: glycosyltransferase family 4 protein, partial [Pyrinomonadaceae bacterium]
KIVPLGIDLEQFTDSQTKRNILRTEISAKSDEIVIGIVGRLTEIKNISLLLRVAKLYKDSSNKDSPKLSFIIIGDGNLRESLEKEAADLNVKDIVEFLGNRNDTDVFCAGLDIVALTSHNEGTPLSLIEAMANGLPVISTAVGGTVDLLGSEIEKKGNFAICERGIKVKPNDAKDFLSGLIYLAKNKTLREKLSRQGKDFVISNYSKERLINEIKDLYRDLFREKG